MVTLLHTLDWVGSIFSLASTLLFVRADIKAWPVGIAATLINMGLYGWLGIYGDMTLEGLYSIMMLYGWYEWLHGGRNKQELNVSHIGWLHAMILVLLAVLGIFSLHYFLHYETNSQVPYLDAFTTIISLCAQWLTCRKIIESWVLWFITDVIYTGLFFYKGIPVHSVLHAVYLVIAIVGYWRWYRLMHPQRK